MTKRIFAFAGLATFGFFAACLQVSCSDDDSAGDNGAVDSGGRRDATPVVEDEAGGGTCLSTDPIDATKIDYKPPTPKQPGACSAAELAALSEYFDDLGPQDDISIEAWQETVGETCRACVFSDGTGETWTPVISIADTDLTINSGGCIALVSDKPDCGRAYQQFTECQLDACFKNCTTSAEFQACLGDDRVVETSCKDAFTALRDECGNKLATYDTACRGKDWRFEGPIKVACGGKPVDAGTDASDAAADADADVEPEDN